MFTVGKTCGNLAVESVLSNRFKRIIGKLPAQLLDAMGDRPRRRRVFPEPQRMQHFMNNGGLDFGNVSAPRTLEIAAA